MPANDDHKTMPIEESLETVGYFVLFCSAVEFYFDTRKPTH